MERLPRQRGAMGLAVAVETSAPLLRKPRSIDCSTEAAQYPAAHAAEAGAAIAATYKRLSASSAPLPDLSPSANARVNTASGSTPPREQSHARGGDYWSLR